MARHLEVSMQGPQWTEEPVPTRSKEWQFNWPLFGCTAIAVLGLVAVAIYRYQQQVESLPQHLLEFAESAEERQDWKLLRSRLHRYLTVNPNDLQATRRLADLYHELGSTPSDLRTAVRLYSQCLTDDEARNDSQLWLRYTAMLSLVNPTAASNEIDRRLSDDSDLEAALRKNPELIDATVLRARLVEQELATSGQSQKELVRQRLIENYEVLTRIDTANADYAQKLALLCRQQADSIASSRADDANRLILKADRLMDRAVEKNADNVDVLLRRFEYRLRYSKSRFPDTSDLQRVLELDQSNPRALMVLAFFLSEGRSDETLTNSRPALLAAKEFLERSMDQLSDRSSALVALANIHMQLGDLQSARAVIGVATKEYPDSQMANVADAKLSLLQERFQDAAESIRRIRAAARRIQTVAWSSPERLNEARIQTLIADVLEADLILRSEEDAEVAHGKASELLLKVDFARLQSQDRVGVLEDIGRLFAKMEDWNNAVQLLERARSTGIISLDSELLLADTYQRVGKLDRAVHVYSQLTSVRLPTNWERTIWFRLGMLRLRDASAVSGLPAWDEIELASKRLSSLAPDSEEAFLLKMSLKQARGIKDSKEVIAELKAAQASFGNSFRYWLLCTEIYRELEQFQSLQFSMDRLSDLALRSDELVAEAAKRPIVTTRMTDDDLKFVRKMSEQWSEKTYEERIELVREWCREIPDSVSARLALANLGAVGNRAEIVEEAVESLQGIEIGGGYFWRITEVSELLVSFREGNLADGELAKQRVNELAAQYPGLALVAQSAAICNETCGDLEAASQHYLRALKIKPAKWAVEGYLRTLVHLRKWDGAREFISQLPDDVQLTSETIDFVVNAFCENGQFEAASEKIKQCVENNNGHSSRTHYLAASVLMRNASRKNALEAHRHLESAVALAPRNLNCWIALFHFEINVFPELWTEEACKTAAKIRVLLRSHGETFAPEWSSLILAQCFQLTGRLADADLFFRKADKQNPELAATGWITRSILSKNATASVSPVTPEVAWLAGEEHARTLAALISIWHEESLVELKIPPDDVRLNAQLAFLHGDEESAIQLLTSLPERERGAGDLVLLASLHGRHDNASDALAARTACLNQPGVPPFAARAILDFALSEEDYELAKTSLSVMGDWPELTLVEQQVLSTRVRLGLGETEGQDLVAWIKSMSQELDAEQRQDYLLQLVEILAKKGHAEESDRLLDHVLPTDSSARGIWLATQIGKTDAAMDWHLAQQEVSPDVNAQFLYRITVHLEDDSRYRAEVIELANRLFEHRDGLSPTSWLMLGAAFERLGLPERALQACEAAMPTLDGTSMVEHHLIWLRGGYLKSLPNPISEIDRLVRVFGPREDLMDTRSVFLLLEGQAEAAKQITRVLTLIDPHDAAYRLHDRLADAAALPVGQRGNVLGSVQPDERAAATVLVESFLQDMVEKESQ